MNPFYNGVKYMDCPNSSERKQACSPILDVVQATVNASASVTSDFCTAAKFFQPILSATMKCLQFPLLLRQGRHAQRNHTSSNQFGLLAAFPAVKTTDSGPDGRLS